MSNTKSRANLALCVFVRADFFEVPRKPYFLWYFAVERYAAGLANNYAHTTRTLKSCAVHTRYTRGTHAVHTQYTRGTHAVHTRYKRGTYAVHTRYIRGTYAVHTRYTRGTHAVHTRHIRDTYTVHTRHIRGTYAPRAFTYEATLSNTKQHAGARRKAEEREIARSHAQQHEGGRASSRFFFVGRVFLHLPGSCRIFP
jgi:hypothetical protein